MIPTVGTFQHEAAASIFLQHTDHKTFVSQRPLSVTRKTENLSVISDFAVFPLHVAHVSLKHNMHNKNSQFYLPPSHHGADVGSKNKNKLRQGNNPLHFSHSTSSEEHWKQICQL